jgi:hypothetical protein
MISSLDKERAQRVNAGPNFQTFNEVNDSLFDGFSADASLADRVPTYAAIDPAILSGLGGIALPTVQLIGRARAFG